MSGPLQSKAFSSASLLAGINTMTAVKSEKPKQYDELQEELKDCLILYICLPFYNNFANLKVFGRSWKRKRSDVRPVEKPRVQNPIHPASGGKAAESFKPLKLGGGPVHCQHERSKVYSVRSVLVQSCTSIGNFSSYYDSCYG